MSQYESVNHPKHYNNYSVEVIDMMVKIYGLDAAISFCELNAFKYRMRMGTKPENSIEQDLKKEQWYLDKASELRANIKHRGTYIEGTAVIEGKWGAGPGLKK